MCGKCRSVCPVFMETMDESLVARGRIRLAKAVAEGELEHSARLAYSLKSCIRCLRCAEYCPSAVPYRQIIAGARRELARQAGVPWTIRFALRHVVTRPLVFRAGLMTARFFQRAFLLRRRGDLRHLPLFLKSPSWVPVVAPRRAVDLLADLPAPKNPRMRVGLFTGCLINQIYPEVALATARVLHRMDIEVLAPRNQVCCGTPAVSFGEEAGLRSVADANARIFKELALDAVITPCATCGSTLKHEYPPLLDDEDWAGAPVLDAVEFICNEGGALLDGLEAAPGAPTATYHDPCHMAFGQGIRAQPRRLLELCARLVEMKDSEICCGGGGTFEVFYPDISEKITAHKVASIKATGAQVVTTACPGCMLHLDSALASSSMPTRTKHVIELLEERLRDGDEAAHEEPRKDAVEAQPAASPA